MEYFRILVRSFKDLYIFLLLKLKSGLIHILILYCFKRTTFTVNELKIYTRHLTILKTQQESQKLEGINLDKAPAKTSFVEVIRDYK